MPSSRMRRGALKASGVPAAVLPRILTVVPLDSPWELIPVVEGTLAMWPTAMAAAAHLPHRVVAGT